jgi:RHS repeat-associated protein
MIRRNRPASFRYLRASEAYAYDDLGRRRRLVRGNGVVTSYTPDAASRLASQADDLAGAARDQSVGLGYNGVSQLTTRESVNDAYTYRGYRPTSQAVVPDALNRIATLNAANVAYDANGNLANDARGNGYGYNLDNQLVAKTNVATLAYDPVGRLQTVSPTAAPATRFEHDPLSGMILAEGAAAPTRRYVPGPGVDEPLVWYEGTERRWYAADERGSITAVTDAAGTALAVNAYDENGVPDPRNLGRFGYTGQAWLGEIGLAYYKARMYAPDLARFLQTDPIGYDGGINLYAYVRGDSVNFTDPWGLCLIATTYYDWETGGPGVKLVPCPSHEIGSNPFRGFEYLGRIQRSTRTETPGQ